MISTGTGVSSITLSVTELSTSRVSEFLRAVAITISSQCRRRAASVITFARSPTSMCTA